MDIRICSSIEEISRDDWNSLVVKKSPFVGHGFLSALESTDCLGERHGWYPAHITIFEKEKLVAAMPAYIKTNSYGELVFDWSWADAYQRAGLAYYPKLVTAIPYTPARGQRMLVDKSCDAKKYRAILLQAAISLCQQQSFSSYHCLFPDEDDLEVLRDSGMMIRQGCQFHWRNKGYQDFDDYLSHFTSRKRKNVRKERRVVQDAGLNIRILHGPQLDEVMWQQLYPFYRDTFLYKGGMPSLTEAFFVEISRSLGEQVIVIAAEKAGAFVAASIFFRSDDTLYGRHWGCHEQFKNLHFELCYYQGIDYAISHGLTFFEPGAQGEYKVSRGFEPVSTWSGHWIADERFGNAIADFVQRENAYIDDYAEAMREELPFRQGESQ